MNGQAFGAKLELVLKALSMSRAQLAAALVVDKSVIGRWITGAVTPSAHNLTRLTQFVAKHRTGFTLLTWEDNFDDVAEFMGIQAGKPEKSRVRDLLPFDLPPAVVAEAAPKIGGYAGIWRITCSAGVAATPELFVHGYSIMRPGQPGALACTTRMFDIRVEGWVVMIHNQLFSTSMETVSGRLHFIILNGLTGGSDLLDGIGLSCRGELGGMPLAWPLTMERLAELSGDADADERAFNALTALSPSAPTGSVSAAMRRHLLRDIGPNAAAAGGELLLFMPAIRSLAAAAARDGSAS